MDKAISFSHDELVQALLRAQEGTENDSSARTTIELVDLLGVSEKVVRKRLRGLIEGGVVEHVRVQRIGINGRPHPTDAYRLVQRPAEGETT